MTQAANAPMAPDDPSTQALAAAMPQIRAAKSTGWAIVAGSVAASVGGVIILAGLAGDDIFWPILAAMLGVFGVLGGFGWTRAKHETAVMPIIAEAFSLSYQKAPKDFYAGLPKNFIPLGGRRSVDDMMSGQVAGRSFRFAECRTETGGKNSSTLFKGVVVEVTNDPKVPDFIIASEKETKGFLFFKGRVQVDGMDLLHQSTGTNGETYGLWTHSSEAARMAGLREFMDRIIALGPRVLGQSSLYSLMSSGSQYYVSLRHSRDLFKIGGLLADDAKVMADIRTAASELAHPVELVTEILKAEQALLAAG